MRRSEPLTVKRPVYSEGTAPSYLPVSGQRTGDGSAAERSDTLIH